jgi:hypothetical protein
MSKQKESSMINWGRESTTVWEVILYTAQEKQKRKESDNICKRNCFPAYSTKENMGEYIHYKRKADLGAKTYTMDRGKEIAAPMKKK